TKKYRGSNSNDGGNTGDGVKIAGGVIGSGDEIDPDDIGDEYRDESDGNDWRHLSERRFSNRHITRTESYDGQRTSSSMLDTLECLEASYSQNSKAYIILNKHTRKVEESLNVTFDETPPPSKTSPLVDDDLDEEEAIKAPKTSHLEAVKRIFRYIKGTTHLGLWYPKGTGIETVVYADSDHAGDYVDRKSTSGICTFVGCCLTSWFSKKQTALAISTTEAEYVSAGKACQQALWMKQALIDYDVRLDDVPIMCDNKGAIDLSKNPVQHSRTKHIEIRHHFLRDNVQKGHISIEKVPSVDNIADILTKPLKRESFNYLRLGLGMMEHIP
ncbi:hypothetical protein Tco_0808108, partial [Tanacetum coccineum]